MLSIQIASWNVFGKEPTEDLCLKNWIARANNPPPELYAIGFQELLWSESFRPGSHVELDSTHTSRTLSTWKKCIEAAIQSSFPEAEFQELGRIQLHGIFLLILMRKDIHHEDEFKNISSCIYRSYTANETGYKGAVALSFDFKGSSFVFVNCHLTPHAERWEDRNEDFRRICSSMKFHETDGGGNDHDHPVGRKVMEHDHVFVFGDLNYRIIPEKLNPTALKEIIMTLSENWKSVLEDDQLKRELQPGGTFGKENFQEGEITFRPTYKYNPGTISDWDTSKQRCPAWCDRILYSHHQSKSVKPEHKPMIHYKQVDYLSHPEFTLSDHKPISSVFYMIS